MNHRYIYAAILVLAIAIGCSSGQETITPSGNSMDSTDTGETASSESQAEGQKTVSYELSPEERSRATQFEQGKKTKISTSYKNMNVGDVHVFGLGIKNVMPDEKKFRVDIRFKEAKTTGGLATPISEAEENTMLSWAGRNRFSTMEIEGNSEKVVPVILEVKPKIAPDENLIPGGYVFEIRVEYETSPQFWDVYSEEEVTLKVKE